MNTRVSQLALLVLVLLTTSTGGIVAVPQEHDLFVLALQWPKGICAWQNCKRRWEDLPELWTIRGFWVTNFTSWVHCDEHTYTPEWDPALLIPLETAWADYYRTKEDTRYYQWFWATEWNTHGACTPFAQRDYFRQALALRRGFDLHGQLIQLGVEPSLSEPITKTQLNEAMVEILGGKIPNLVCYRKYAEGKNFLQEIRICYDRTFQLADFPETQIRAPGTDVETRPASCEDIIMYN